MNTLLNWGVRFLDLVSPVRKRRKESAQPEQPQRPQRLQREASTPIAQRKHTIDSVYKIKKYYRAKHRLPRNLIVRATKAATMIHGELEDEDDAKEQTPNDEAADLGGPDDAQYGRQEDDDEYEGEDARWEGEVLGDFSEGGEEQDRKSAERDLMYQKIIEDVSPEGWSEDELTLYCRLRMRGREPMLPHHWRGDFNTIPSRLFGNEEGVLINSYCQNTFRATQALHLLFKLGGRVRDRELAGLPVEGVMKREVERYVRWSQEDGEFSRKPYIPVLAIVASTPKQTEEELEDRIRIKLEALAVRYREAYTIPAARASSSHSSSQYVRPLPTLYGIVISGIVMGFVTYNSANEDAVVRSIGLFDYSSHANDVWNGIAIAYLVISARNYLTGILEDVEAESAETSDPDA
ncbi:MAG: hypothetical protein M1840_003184 [Geoglossum simile]|nr:MAG: hypothetical protein M1840_003184 [Geoglossum simile]